MLPYLSYQGIRVINFADGERILIKKKRESQPAFTCSKITIETLEQGVKYVQWRSSGVFIVNFEHISRLIQVFLLLTLSNEMPAGNT